MMDDVVHRLSYLNKQHDRDRTSINKKIPKSAAIFGAECQIFTFGIRSSSFSTRTDSTKLTFSICYVLMIEN